jgi:hypothetical protein
MLFNFVTACGISAAFIVWLTSAALRDRRRGWVRRRSNFVEELMTDWVNAHSAALPDVTIGAADTQAAAPQPGPTMTSDLLALDKRLGRVKVRVQKTEAKAKVTEEKPQQLSAERR